MRMHKATIDSSLPTPVRGRPVPQHFERCKTTFANRELLFRTEHVGINFLRLTRVEKQLIQRLSKRERYALDRFNRIKDRLDGIAMIDPNVAWGLISRGLGVKVIESYPWHIGVALTPLGRRIAVAIPNYRGDFVHVYVDKPIAAHENSRAISEEEWLLGQLHKTEKEFLLGALKKPRGLFGLITVNTKVARLLEARKLVERKGLGPYGKAVVALSGLGVRLGTRLATELGVSTRGPQLERLRG